MRIQNKYKHYVPVLRWKAAEMAAISQLSDDVKSSITPLVELCPSAFFEKKPRTTSPELILSKKILELAKSFAHRPVYVDLVNVPESIKGSDGNHLWDTISRLGPASGLEIIPVTGFYGRGIEYQKKIKEVHNTFQFGIAVRLSKKDVFNPRLSDNLSSLSDLIEKDFENVDLLIDLKLVDGSIPDFESILEKIPSLVRWRSLTIIAGSFPIDLSSFKANNVYSLDRNEWEYWRNNILKLRQHSEIRLPSFGDYTIQHPIYKEPPPFPHVSASIRYTSENSWIVFRGEWIGKKNGSGSAQYPAEAQLLVDRSEYCGVTFSDGDRFIAEKARNGIKPGNPKQWLQAGINHHVTLTAKLVQSDTLSIKKTSIEMPVKEGVNAALVNSTN